MIIFDFEKRRQNMAHHTNIDLLRQLAWDYNIPAGDLLAVIQGRKESAGHYSQSKIFKKILESYSWFTVLQLFTPAQVKELLTDDLVKSLRMPSLQQKYAYIQKRLRETLPVTG
jgi:hypothetical protein